MAAAIAWLCCAIAPTGILRVALAAHSVARQLLAPLWFLTLLPSLNLVPVFSRMATGPGSSMPPPVSDAGTGAVPMSEAAIRDLIRQEVTSAVATALSGPPRSPPGEEHSYTCYLYRLAYVLHGAPSDRERTGHAASRGRESGSYQRR